MHKGKQLNKGTNIQIIKHHTQAALPISSFMTVVTLLPHEGQLTIVGHNTPSASEGYFFFSFYLDYLFLVSLFSLNRDIS